MKSLVKIICICLLISGCMAGKMSGLMSDNQQVIIHYEQGLSSDIYRTVIDGEAFEGRAVMLDATSSFGTVYGANINSNSVYSTYTGRVKAVLLGNKGSSLRCLMNYADSSGFTTAGGVGECAHTFLHMNRLAR
jgi:hypothetical protein